MRRQALRCWMTSFWKLSRRRKSTALPVQAPVDHRGTYHQKTNIAVQFSLRGPATHCLQKRWVVDILRAVKDGGDVLQKNAGTLTACRRKIKTIYRGIIQCRNTVNRI